MDVTPLEIAVKTIQIKCKNACCVQRVTLMGQNCHKDRGMTWVTMPVTILPTPLHCEGDF